VATLLFIGEAGENLFLFPAHLPEIKEKWPLKRKRRGKRNRLAGFVLAPPLSFVFGGGTARTYQRLQTISSSISSTIFFLGLYLGFISSFRPKFSQKKITVEEIKG